LLIGAKREITAGCVPLQRRSKTKENHLRYLHNPRFNESQHQASNRFHLDKLAKFLQTVDRSETSGADTDNVIGRANDQRSQEGTGRYGSTSQ
jgi:hypothetical protein